MVSRRIQLGLRLILAVTFLFSGALKTASPREATNLVYVLTSINPQVGAPLVIFVSLLEIFLGIMLILGGKYLPVVSFLAGCLLLSFTVIGALVVSESIPCGCFGDLLHSQTGAYLVLRNIALLIISLFVLRSSIKRSPEELGESK